jgi:hypothetical protein
MVSTRSSSYSSSNLSPALVVASSKPKNKRCGNISAVSGAVSTADSSTGSQRPKRTTRVYNHDVESGDTNGRSIFTRSAKTAAMHKYKIHIGAAKEVSPPSHIDEHRLSVRSQKQSNTEKVNEVVPRRSTRIHRQVNYSDDCDRNTVDDGSVDNGSVDNGSVDNECLENYSDYNINCAAEGLLQLNSNEKSNIKNSICINPVSPCVRYMSRIQVSSCDGSQSYVTCYMIYNSKTKRYHLHNSHTMIEMIADSLQQSSPTRTHVLYTKYTSYIQDIIEKYIMNVIVHKGIQTCVVVDYLGLVMSDTEFQDLFDEDTSCGDIEALIQSKKSNQTTTRDSVFVLTPPVTYQFSTFHNTHIQDILSIISGQF